MLSKHYESTEVDRRTWLHVPSGTHWSTSSDNHQVVEINKNVFKKKTHERQVSENVTTKWAQCSLTNTPLYKNV